MIEKIPLEAPKAPSRHSVWEGNRLRGIALNGPEEEIAKKLNEIIDLLNGEEILENAVFEEPN